MGYYYLQYFNKPDLFPFISSYISPWAEKLFIVTLILSVSIITLKVFDEIIFAKYLYGKANIHVPNLFRDIIVFTLLAGIIATTLRVEFGFRLTGLLTSSAILSAIIGLALQDTLSNIISGIVLHIEKPFEIGDWIKIGEQEGEVVEISWRATRLRTIDGNFIVIPNINTSKEIVLNYYKPTKDHAITIKIGIDYSTPPASVKETVLKTIKDCDNILLFPDPAVNVLSFGDSSILYEIKFWIRDHSLLKRIQDDVMTKLWYSLKRKDIHIPFPIQTVYLKQEDKAPDTSLDLETKMDMIKKIELFHDLSGNDLIQIAKTCSPLNFTSGEKIVTLGDEGHSLFLVAQGTVDVVNYDSKGSMIHLKELSSGNYFGEMSLLTGEKRSATVMAKNEVSVLKIASENIVPIIKKNPKIMEAISHKLAERKVTTKDIMDKAILNEKLAEKEALSVNILGKIRAFFSIGQQ